MKTTEPTQYVYVMCTYQVSVRRVDSQMSRIYIRLLNTIIRSQRVKSQWHETIFCFRSTKVDTDILEVGPSLASAVLDVVPPG